MMHHEESNEREREGVIFDPPLDEKTIRPIELKSSLLDYTVVKAVSQAPCAEWPYLLAPNKLSALQSLGSV